MSHFPITWRTLIAVILVVWLLILVYITVTLHQGYLSSEHSASEIHNWNVDKNQFKSEINSKDLQIKLLEEKLTNLGRDVARYKNQVTSSTASKATGRSVLSGQTRYGGLEMFRVEYNVRELWYYFSNNLKGKNLEEFKDRHHMLASDLNVLKSSIGPSGWRQKQFNRLSNKIQTSFYKLQNPPICNNARLLICNLNKLCGFGCQMHHLIYCFIIAYGSGRTMILDGKVWQYSHKGWTGTYKPVSETCTKSNGPDLEWSEINQDFRILNLPLVDFIHYKPDYMPLAVPKSYYKELKDIHGDPFVWFVGQILKFLLKPNEETSKMLTGLDKMLEGKHPIVGVHIRRTDKVGTEAAFHDIKEYMEHVNERFAYYDQLYGRNVTRRIYLATDDSKLIVKSRKEYPEYEIIGDASISLTAQLGTRYKHHSLGGIISDVHLLSKTDFLVCTFSSQVCRIAYEIMQQNNEDMSSNFHSLDDFYYYGGQQDHRYVARRGHLNDMKKGDIMRVAGNHWNGDMMAKNRRTDIEKNYPAYKMEDIKTDVEFLGEKN